MGGHAQHPHQNLHKGNSARHPPKQGHDVSSGPGESPKDLVIINGRRITIRFDDDGILLTRPFRTEQIRWQLLKEVRVHAGKITFVMRFRHRVKITRRRLAERDRIHLLNIVRNWGKRYRIKVRS